MDYIGFDGFYDLRAFAIPKREFNKLAKVQSFLFSVEQRRIKGIIHPQINEIRELSANYQQVLFSFPIINPSLL